MGIGLDARFNPISVLLPCFTGTLRCTSANMKSKGLKTYKTDLYDHRLWGTRNFMAYLVPPCRSLLNYCRFVVTMSVLWMSS